MSEYDGTYFVFRPIDYYLTLSVCFYLLLFGRNNYGYFYSPCKSHLLSKSQYQRKCAYKSIENQFFDASVFCCILFPSVSSDSHRHPSLRVLAKTIGMYSMP
jgi:hypothetical protein